MNGAEEEGGHDEGPVRTLDAPVATITVDGDPADWAGIAGLDVTLTPILDEDVAPKDAMVKVAHDDEFIYLLYEVQDDYNWTPEDARLSAAAAVEWTIDPEAAAHMGAEDSDLETSFGTVDIWHWRLKCPAGEESGGGEIGRAPCRGRV